MILAAVDDLLFSSKIRAAARGLDAPIVFARTPADVLAQARATRPTLVIFDLNATRLDPLGTLAALKSDASLAGIQTIGFVSHVQTDLIDAARRAGIGDVLPRSAFAAGLGDILARAQ